MRKLFLALVIIAVAAAAFYGWRRLHPEVIVVFPETGTAIEAVYATGIVEPKDWAKVSSTITGRIDAFLVNDGDTVEKGQALARLDDREAKAHVRELVARENYWRDELERQKSLQERGVASKATHELAQSEYLQALAATAAGRQRLSDYSLAAPMSGIVLRRDGEPGEVVDKREVLLWVGRSRPLRITADVDEEDIALVEPGQKVLVKADAFPGVILDGMVGLITPKGDPINKSFRVRVDLPDDTPLLIGMTVEINIEIKKVQNALLLDEAALVRDSVFVVENGIVHERRVETGIRGRRNSQILSGLSLGERVVLSPSKTLKDGDRVRSRAAAAVNGTP